MVVRLLSQFVVLSKHKRYANEVYFYQAPLEKEEFLDWRPNLDPNDKGSDLDRPTVFRWTGAGKEVFISGSFNNWTNKIPLIRRCVNTMGIENVCTSFVLKS